MRKKILVVDSEVLIQKLMKRALEGSSHEMVSAYNGAVALEFACLEKPDLIILDKHLTIVSTKEVVKELRSSPCTRNIPILLVSQDMSLFEELGLQAGVDDCVGKPFNIAQIMECVNKLLPPTSRAVHGASPMTLLPGSSVIEEETKRLISSGDPFAFLSIDIDNFTLFNDYYGYGCGDRVIEETARLLREAVRSVPEAFVGHKGGDDFVILVPAYAAERVAKFIASEFGECLRELGQFPRMTLSIAVVSSQRRALHHYGKVNAIAEEIQRELKFRDDSLSSAFQLDRKRDAEATCSSAEVLSVVQQGRSDVC